MPATKAKPKAVDRKKAAKPKSTLRTEPVIQMECYRVPVTTMDLPTAAVSACPFQPRQEFPAEEIEQLAQSIAADGLIHPIAVRPNPDADGYQLVDGERRLRACRLLKLNTIRAEIGEWTDAQVMRIVVASALQRRDLNAIEEALAFQRAIEAGVAAGPTELARQLGVSQGHVSNRIRLLDLPEDWKARVISGEIPPTHARSLVRYRDCPRILAEVKKGVCDDDWDEIYHGRCTVDQFDDYLHRIVVEETRPLTGKWRSQATHWRDVPIFKATEEQLADLAPVEVEVNGKPQQRATNVDLWDKLQAEYMARRNEHAEKREAAAKKKQTKAKDLSPAEKKAAAAEEKRKAKERLKVFQKRLYEWHLNWLRYLIGERLRREASMQELLVIAMYATTVHVANNRIGLAGGLKDACKTEAPDVTIDVKRSHFGPKVDVMGVLVQLGGYQIEPVLARTMSEWFWDEDGPVTVAYPEDLDPLAVYLAIDQPAAWREDQAGSLSLAYWNLHNKEQLLELAKELGVEVEASAKKTTLVEAFMARNDVDIDPLGMPKELQNVKRPK